jgi:NAD(P)-dependent dehydrogenase (short-subunit alcohol dehydrogenase family)
MSENNTGPVAVVTGAANGIGLATAHELGRRGFRVVYADLDTAGAQRAAMDAGQTGVSSHFVGVDITDGDSVTRMVQSITQNFGALDVLVNNAGLPAKHASSHITDQEWTQMLDVNLTGAFKCSRAAYPLLLQSRRAAIVNMSSIAGMVGMADRAGYGAAKAGLIGLTRVLAVEWAASGIRVNAVAPGYVRTEGFERRMLGATADVVAELERFVPLGRMCSPKEIAAVVCFLASEDASYITGQTIVVDGGLSVAARG